jgi:hypothetical protein
LPIAPVLRRETVIYDLLSTAQAGLAAVITGQDDVADLAYRWVVDLVDQQPLDAGSRFYSFRRGPTLIAEPEGQLTWLALTDFSKPRQSFYTPGMAAVFLASYAQRKGKPEPLQLASRLLEFNINGCAEQFEDSGSVQVCKFGWGAAAMLVADPDGDWLTHVHDMGNWFINNQHQDGAWAPSSFLVDDPSDIDKLVKTAEHVMEVNAILSALGTARAR